MNRVERGRLGGKAKQSRMTEEERSLSAQKMHLAWILKTNPQQRREWARKAAIASNLARWGVRAQPVAVAASVKPTLPARPFDALFWKPRPASPPPAPEQAEIEY